MDRPGNRTPISWLQARRLPVGPAAHRIEPNEYDKTRQNRESSPRESNPRLPDVSRAPCRWTRGRRVSNQRSVAEVGVEPTSTSLSSWRLCQFAYPADISRIAGMGVEPILRAYETRPSAGPPARRVPGPGLEPGYRPHEGQRGSRPPGMVFVPISNPSASGRS
jgi:hypothetical protein